jgi:GTP-binding protein
MDQQTALPMSAHTAHRPASDRRQDIRNIAIIAHVDHGKTTLVDAVLRQTHVHRKINDMGERIMDSMDQERERGITIRAKNASVIYQGVKINIVDTPGHADFGGEVERTLRMVDGVLLLVDAKEGPMPQTTFVLRKALALGHKAIVVINKIDRPDAVVDDVLNRTFDLFVHLGATNEQLDFPIVYASAINGIATLDLNRPGTDISPLLDTILNQIPAPAIRANAPLQMLVLALAYDSYKGKMGIGKILAGSIAKRQTVAQMKRDGSQVNGRVAELAVFSGLERRGGRNRRRGGHPRHQHRRDDRRSGTADRARAGRHRRADRADDLLRQQQPLRRPRGQVPHLPAPARASVQGVGDQRVPARPGNGQHRSVPGGGTGRTPPVGLDRADAPGRL